MFYSKCSVASPGVKYIILKNIYIEYKYELITLQSKNIYHNIKIPDYLNIILLNSHI